MQVDVDQRADLVEELVGQDAPALVLLVHSKVVARVDRRASVPKIEAMLEAHLEPVLD